MATRAPRTAALPKPGQVALHKLPPLLRRLVRVLGEAPAYRLVEAYGGTYIVVPARVLPAHAQHPVCELVGAQAWAALVEAFGPDTLQLPKTDSLLRQVRHERVRELAAEARATGRPLRAVALATGYSLRQVHNILDLDPPEGLQLDLFAAPAPGHDAPAADGDPARAAPLPTAHDPFGLGRA